MDEFFSDDSDGPPPEDYQMYGGAPRSSTEVILDPPDEAESEDSFDGLSMEVGNIDVAELMARSGVKHQDPLSLMRKNRDRSLSVYSEHTISSERKSKKKTKKPTKKPVRKSEIDHKSKNRLDTHLESLKRQMAAASTASEIQKIAKQIQKTVELINYKNKGSKESAQKEYDEAQKQVLDISKVLRAAKERRDRAAEELRRLS